MKGFIRWLYSIGKNWASLIVKNSPHELTSRRIIADSSFSQSAGHFFHTNSVGNGTRYFVWNPVGFFFFSMICKFRMYIGSASFLTSFPGTDIRNESRNFIQAGNNIDDVLYLPWVGAMWLHTYSHAYPEGKINVKNLFWILVCVSVGAAACMLLFDMLAYKSLLMIEMAEKRFAFGLFSSSLPSTECTRETENTIFLGWCLYWWRKNRERAVRGFGKGGLGQKSGSAWLILTSRQIPTSVLRPRNIQVPKGNMHDLNEKLAVMPRVTV